MEWNDLKVFLAIARHHTLSEAARHLGQTQPTVGRRLKILEESLGQKLFQRTADGFFLTDEGMSVLVHAERIEEEAFSFERELQGKAKEPSGPLRILSWDWFGAYMVTSLLAELRRRHPQIRSELLIDARVLSLSRREADIAFRLVPFDEPDIIQHKVVHVPYALYGHRKLPKPNKGDGRGCDLIMMDDSFSDMPDVPWLKKLLPNGRVVFQSNNREVHAQMCAEGQGYAVLPKALAKRFPELICHEGKDIAPGKDVWMGYHRDLARLSRIKALVSLVAEKWDRPKDDTPPWRRTKK